MSEEQVKLVDNTAYISLREIPENFITNNKQISAIVFENGVETIKSGAIHSTKIIKIALPSTIRLIEQGAISCDNLKTIVIDKCDHEGKVHRYKLNCKQVYSIATVKDDKSPTGTDIYVDYEGVEDLQ